MDDQLTPIGQPPENMPETPGPMEPGELGLEPGPPPEEPTPSGADKLRAFVATSQGKAIVIGGTAAVVVVLGVVAYLVMSAMSGSQKPTVTGVTPGATPAGTPATATAQGATTGAQETTEAEGGLPEAFEVFENKDPFKPLIVSQPEPTLGGTTSGTTDGTTTGGTTTGGTTSGSSSSSSGSSSGSTSTNSITLKSITSSGGEYEAVLVYGGKTYTVGAGERVDSSPWKVLDVGSSSVTLQYGDEVIVLRLGSSVVMR